MPTIAEKINRLSDQQVLSIVDSLAGEFAAAETPEGREEQVQALQNLFAQEDIVVDVARAADADPAATAAAARQLLAMMEQVPELQPSVHEWLDHPPTQEAAAIPLVLAAPVVLTGCVAFLTVIGHVRFKRHSNGTWEVEYDPTRPSSIDDTMGDTITVLAGLMRSMVP